MHFEVGNINACSIRGLPLVVDAISGKGTGSLYFSFSPTTSCQFFPFDSSPKLEPCVISNLLENSFRSSFPQVERFGCMPSPTCGTGVLRHSLHPRANGGGRTIRNRIR